MSNLLSNLNPEQLQAVTLPRVSALVLAGAGSGKTRVLTTRIAYLIQSGQASPAGILAVTFTNKAAREMTSRLEGMLPINTRGMWIGTFHGLCNRLLRAHYRDAMLPQTFQILDSADQQSAVKRVLKSMNVDEEKFKPREMCWFINGAKEQGLRYKDVEAHDEFTRRQVEIFQAYDEQCQKEGVVDFAELLLRCYELLSRNAPLLEHYRDRFKFILVDEFQDTNKLQYRWIRLLAGNQGAVFAVGDDDQCLVAGTKITLSNGRKAAIEKVQKGDMVLSCQGSSQRGPAEVVRTYVRERMTALVEIQLENGATLISTPEHTHFAGYLLGETPQLNYVYLMWKRGVGFRLGTSQTYTKGQRKPMVGFKQRALQEHADALWVVSTHQSENEARAQEMLLSLKYGLPTLPFVPRKGKALNGLVHDSEWIAKVYREMDTPARADRLMADFRIDPQEPHHLPQSRNSNRRNVNITLCGDGRGKTSLHRIAVFGNDSEGMKCLQKLGLGVREAKPGSLSWRYETSFKEFGKALEVAQLILKALPAKLPGRLNLRAAVNSTPLPFVRAGMVRPGMMMMTESGELSAVHAIRWRPPKLRKVYDLDIQHTHNFFANGIVTHNSIYGFRGAETGNMRDFQHDFHVQEVIKLEQNYRSHGAILDAANAVIKHNSERLGKNLWTDAGKGEPLRIFAAANDNEEAQFIVDEVKSLHREGMNLNDIALLYRSNAQSRVLEHSLFRAGLSYRVYGGLRFFERQEVKHALAYMRLAANPDDDGAFTRVVNFPPRGIGARSIEQLQDAANMNRCSLMQAAKSFMPPGRSAAALGTFISIIDGLKASAETLTLSELVEEIVERSSLKAHYQSEREGAERIENLAELTNAAALFNEEYEGEDKPLIGFLTHASLESGEHEAGSGDDALQLMTVHAAKGLEFDAVFLSGLEEGLFPHDNSMNQLDGIEEERRLMYVAITRARKRLYLSYAGSRMLHGQPRYGVVSRFVDEIPSELCKWIVLPEKVATFNTYSRGGQGDFFAKQDSSGRSAGGYRPQAGTARDPMAMSIDKDTISSQDMQRARFETSRPDAHPFGIGQNVTHAKFGEGVVINFEGTGLDARVHVKFRDVGTKILALQYAKLTAA